MEHGTLGELHLVIQSVMGWQCCHLCEFEIDGRVFLPEIAGEFAFEFEMENADSIPLSDVLPGNIESRNKFRFLYTYDMGDNWQHEVVFEGYQPRAASTVYPVCLGGENACPPEDCGGIWGFYEMLDAVSDSDHSEHEHVTEWLGEFDPGHFELDEINESMRTDPTRLES